MKYLFIVQGEGRGHLTQALALSDILRRAGHEVCEVLVGKCSNRELPQFFIDKIESRIRRFDSPAIEYGKLGRKGKILSTLLSNTTPRKLAAWRKSIDLIERRINKTNPDVVINFYEILAGLTYFIRRVNVPMISVAHQFLIDHPDYKPDTSNEKARMMLRLLNMLCSYGTTKTLALSFYPLKDYYRARMAVVPPLLRNEIINVKTFDHQYILGYVLNHAYVDDIKAWHKSNPGTRLHIFWDKKDAQECIAVDSGFTLHKINDEKFVSFMAGCSGYITTAGFESICEAMYMKKPVMMIPAHPEQEINAADAVHAGAGISSRKFDVSDLEDFITKYQPNDEFPKWVRSAEEVFLRHLTTFV